MSSVTADATADVVPRRPRAGRRRHCGAEPAGLARLLTDVGILADPVDGYLVTVQLPASARGETVDVDFRPPGWTAEIAAWVLALVGGRAGRCSPYAVAVRARPG